MKIIAGTLKGRSISIPQNSTIEPVKSEVCNAIFSMLGEAVIGAACLDLFAGTGALGLEALSRGANSCQFVEGDRETAEIIKESITSFNLTAAAEVIYDNVKHAIGKLQTKNEKWSIIFLDPPYVTPVNHLLKLISGILQQNGFVVYLCSTTGTYKVPEGLELYLQRCYGQTKAVILKKI